MKDATGVIHGRFQIVHNDHVKYLLAGKARCDFLFVGITNPDPSHTKKDAAGGNRSEPFANPLTYFERFLMVRSALLAEGVAHDEFAIVPFPINFPELYGYYVPLDATFYLTIYDEWGEKKLSLFESLGLKTEILWRRGLAEKGLTATDVRRSIREGGRWEKLVPPEVARYINEMNLVERLVKLAEDNCN